MSNSINITIPVCVQAFENNYVSSGSDENKMRFVLSAAKSSLEWGLGGPFAAAIFRQDTHQLISLGVNLIVSQGLSMLHAEMVAIMRSQHLLGTYDLGTPSLPAMELFTSTEPCAMCLGGSHWSGIKRIVSGATDADASSIGFDEGPKPNDWAAVLRTRGIDVTEELLRDEARQVLQDYQRLGGDIYNSLRNTF